MDYSKILELIPYGKEGGWVMPFIYFFAVVATAVFLERLWFLRRKKLLSWDLMNRLNPLIKDGRWKDIEVLLEPLSTPAERIAHVIVKNRDDPPEMLKELVEDAGKRERDILEKGIGLISLTVSISPLLGLLGTVSGMIKVFRAISQQAIGNPERLASGISEALLTTFAGLTTAIIALLMWSYLMARVKKITGELEDFSIQLLQKVKKK